MKKTVIIVLLISIIILGIIQIIRIIGEKENKTIVNINKINLIDKNQLNLRYSYVGELPEFKQGFDIYNYEKTSIEKFGISKIAENLGFVETGKVVETPYGKVIKFYSSNEGKNLVFSENPNRLKYDNNSNVLGNKLKENEIIESAESFLNQLLLNKNLNLGKPFLEFKTNYGPSNYIKTNFFDTADYIEVRFNLEIESVPLLNSSFANEAIAVLVNTDGSIKKASIVLPPENFISLGKVNITKSNQALDAINKGLGTIVKIDNPYEVYSEVVQNDVSSAELNSLELVYIFDEKTLLIQPYYRFSGIAETKDENKLDIEVLITALPDEVYKQ